MAEQGSYVTFPSANKAGPGCGMLFGDPKICPLGLIVIHEWLVKANLLHNIIILVELLSGLLS